jgi:DNA modification methylase
LKNPSGAIRNSLIESFQGVEYKLACTATPAPNDTAEYASHALFLERIKSYQEFFQTYFIQDEGEWRLKKHSVESFYTYLSSWSVFLRNPKMYGFADNLAELQEYVTHEMRVPLTDEQLALVQRLQNQSGQMSLVPGAAGSMTERIKYSQISKGFIYSDKRKAMPVKSLKPEIVAEIAKVKHPSEQCIIWTTYTEEGEILHRLIPDAVHLHGGIKEEARAQIIEGFRIGKVRVLITKPKLLGFGLNFQFANIQIFSGLDDSYEKYYQAIKRSHRYGAKKQLIVYIPVTELEEPMLRNVLTKKEQFEIEADYQERLYISNLKHELEEFLKRPLATMEEKGMTKLEPVITPRFELYHEDCIQFMARTPENTFDMSFFSPPFDDLFTYSDSPEDLSNCQRDGEFRLHNDFFFAQLYRVMKPGRVVAIHIAQNAKMKFKDGSIGLIDLRGQFISQALEHGFEYFSEACVERSPQLQMHKEKMLFHKNISTNALNTKLGMNYYVIFLKKQGEAAERVKSQVSLDQWYEWASGVWKVNESDYLNVRGVKNEKDERHVTPTNLEIIRRSIILYSNLKDKVFCPYGGCGSEGVKCMELDRHFTMTELKAEYFQEAVENIKDSHDRIHNQSDLFDWLEDEENEVQA